MTPRKARAAAVIRSAGRGRLPWPTPADAAADLAGPTAAVLAAYLGRHR
jgi:hypothetical protein